MKNNIPHVFGLALFLAGATAPTWASSPTTPSAAPPKPPIGTGWKANYRGGECFVRQDNPFGWSSLFWLNGQHVVLCKTAYASETLTGFPVVVATDQGNYLQVGDFHCPKNRHTCILGAQKTEAIERMIRQSQPVKTLP